MGRDNNMSEFVIMQFDTCFLFLFNNNNDYHPTFCLKMTWSICHLIWTMNL